jgi:thioredoxin reductase (NADPH)
MPDAPLDCHVMGAGAAGLTAAIYLARFRRRFQVIDGGASRAALIPMSHNHAGYPGGIHRATLIERMTARARMYGASIRPGTVSGLQRRPDGTFLAKVCEDAIAARTVLLATGVVDRGPELPDVTGVIQRGRNRHCDICDGYEVIGHRVGIVGQGSSGLHQALFLRTYTSDITLLSFLSFGTPKSLSREERRTAESAALVLVEGPVTSVTLGGDRIISLTLRSGVCHVFDTVYSALRSDARSSLVRPLGTTLDDNGCVVTDEHQRSSTASLFAAGDVVRSPDQISVAMGEAAIAATVIHNLLRGAPSPASPIDTALSSSPGRLDTERIDTLVDTHAARRLARSSASSSSAVAGRVA